MKKKNPTGWRPFKKFHAEMMKKPKFRKAYNDLEPEYAIVDAVIKKRIKENLTQSDLAKRMKTKQPVVSRLEMGTLNPSVKFLKRVAKALDAKLYISIK
jgi:ribosome-binding protein aMBF1 (putative translation factor)